MSANAKTNESPNQLKTYANEIICYEEGKVPTHFPYDQEFEQFIT